MTMPPITPVSTYVTPTDVMCSRRVSWGAIFAGSVAAVGIHLLLSLVGASIGLATFSPLTDENPVKAFGAGAAIVWTICALIALFVGGWVAGRFAPNLKSGCLHGALVWSVTMIVTFSLISLGVGVAVGGAVKVVGEGLGAVGKAAAAGVGKIADEGVKRGADQLSSFVDEAVQSVPTNAAPKAAIRAKREVGMAVTRLFAPGQDLNSQESRAAVVQALMGAAGMTENDANRMVDDWMNTAKTLKADLDKAKAAAEQKAREAADRAATRLAKATAFTFFAFILGLSMAAVGGTCGAKCAARCAVVEVETVVR